MSPALLIVHGAYFLPDAWSLFEKQFRDRGYETSCPRLPTCGDSRPPQATLADDVTAVRTSLKELVKHGHEVIILAHSWGGVVASEALSQSCIEELSSDGRPGVVALVYLSAWLVLPGQTISDVVEKYGFLCDVDLGFNDDGMAWAKNPVESFYNDMEPAEIQRLSIRNVTHNIAAANTKVTCAPWRIVPSSYIQCMQDRAIKTDLQQGMIKDVNDILSGSASLHSHLSTSEFQAGHCPFLSKPHELFEVIDGIRLSVSSH